VQQCLSDAVELSPRCKFPYQLGGLRFGQWFQIKALGPALDPEIVEEACGRVVDRGEGRTRHQVARCEERNRLRGDQLAQAPHGVGVDQMGIVNENDRTVDRAGPLEIAQEPTGGDDGARECLGENEVWPVQQGIKRFATAAEHATDTFGLLSRRRQASGHAIKQEGLAETERSKDDHTNSGTYAIDDPLRVTVDTDDAGRGGKFALLPRWPINIHVAPPIQTRDYAAHCALVRTCTIPPLQACRRGHFHGDSLVLGSGIRLLD